MRQDAVAPLSAVPLARAFGLEPDADRDGALQRVLGKRGAAWFVGADAQALRLAFYATALANGHRALMISSSPAALVRDQAKLTAAKVATVRLGTPGARLDADALKRLLRKDARVVLAVSDAIHLEDVAAALARAEIGAVAVDDAQLVAPAAHELRPSYERAPALVKGLGKVALCLLARPSRAEVVERALTAFGVPAAARFGAPLVRDGVVVDAWPVRGERRNFALLTLLSELTAPGVVLAATPHEVDAAYGALSAAGIAACRVHSGMPLGDRRAAMARFLDRSQPPLALLTTSAVGADSGLSGIGEAEDSEPRPGFGLEPSRDDLRFLVHYHAPSSFEQYARELSWLSADGKGARAVTLYDSAARSLNDAILEQQRVLGRQVRELQRVLGEALQASRQPTVEWLALQSGLSRRTSDRIVALLADAGAIRRAEKAVLPHGTPEEVARKVEDVAVRLEALRAADRTRLAAVERWADGRECRARFFVQYFGGELARCGSCAGCVAIPGRDREEARRAGGVRA